MHPQLSICVFITSDHLAQPVATALSRDRYAVTQVRSPKDFFQFIEKEKKQLDCLLLEAGSDLSNIVNWLHGQATLLPAVILLEQELPEEGLVKNGPIKNEATEDGLTEDGLTEDGLTEDGLTEDGPIQEGETKGAPSQGQAVASQSDISGPASSQLSESLRDADLVVQSTFTYHIAEVSISISQLEQIDQFQLEQIDQFIDRAIAQFIELSPVCRASNTTSITSINQDLSTQNFLMLQQRRLTEKLKERLGYLGVYYKRNPQNFFRHLPPDSKQELLDGLKMNYRDIVLCYFANDGTLNQRIDDFVNTVFFTDIPVSQIVEIHMDLMDEFSKQLKLEGRSEEILLDYRLTLIDTIAHLCEMYRRSIPREA